MYLGEMLFEPGQAIGGVISLVTYLYTTSFLFELVKFMDFFHCMCIEINSLNFRDRIVP